MATTTHSAMTDPELHEPKGVAAATTGQVYVANGSGSGTWQEQGGASYAVASWVGNAVAEASMAADTPVTLSAANLTLNHQDGGYTLNATSDGILVPKDGDYEVHFNLSGVANPAGTDKFVLTVDTYVSGVAENHAVRHYFDRVKDQHINGFAIISGATAGDDVVVKVMVATGDGAGGAFPYTGFTVSNFNFAIHLLHEVV